MKIGKVSYNVNVIKELSLEQFTKTYPLLKNPVVIYERITGKKLEKKKPTKKVETDK